MEGLREIQNYEQFKKALDTELADQAAGFVRTGYLLKVARDTDILASSGYSTVAEFAKAEYGLEKDVVSRYIAINDRYSEGGYSERLQEKYEGYGVGKLQDMLTLPADVVELIPPEMTRKEIAKVKAEVKEEEEITPVEVALESPDDDMEDMSLSEKAIYQYAKDNPDKWNAICEWADSPTAESLMDILAPSGVAVLASRPAGTGKVLISIKTESEQVETLAVRTGEKETLSSTRYADVVFKLFQDATKMPEVAPVQQESVPEKPDTVTETPKTVSEKQKTVTEKPKNVEKTECEVLSGEVIDTPEEEASHTEDAPVAAGLDKNVIRGYTAAVSASIKKLERLWENRELDKCLDELTGIRWRIEQIQKEG